MKLTRSSVVLEYKLISSFESLRKTLLADPSANRLDKPLAFWALPDDRRLPLAFMDRTLRSILETPFDDLFSTPGVGQKKITSLMKLLARAAREQPADEAALLAAAAPQAEVENSDTLDPGQVSEATWARWRSSVARHGLENETLGRFAPSLEILPRVMWDMPLGKYVNLSLGKIRRLKTHGEKRVHALLQVFGGLHQMLSRVEPSPGLAVRIVPRFVAPIEAWMTRALSRTELPSPEEIDKHFVQPLIAQIEIDAGSDMAKLAANRMSANPQTSSVRHVARKLGLTRARVYQLLADMATIIHTRWPEGQALVAELNLKFQRHGRGTPAHLLFEQAASLFFAGPKAPDEEEADDDSAALRRRAG